MPAIKEDDLIIMQNITIFNLDGKMPNWPFCSFLIYSHWRFALQATVIVSNQVPLAKSKDGKMDVRVEMQGDFHHFAPSFSGRLISIPYYEVSQQLKVHSMCMVEYVDTLFIVCLKSC